MVTETILGIVSVALLCACAWIYHLLKLWVWWKGQADMHSKNAQTAWGQVNEYSQWVKIEKDIEDERLLLSNLKDASRDLKNEIYLEMDRKQRQTVIYRRSRG